MAGCLFVCFVTFFLFFLLVAKIQIWYGKQLHLVEGEFIDNRCKFKKNERWIFIEGEKIRVKMKRLFLLFFLALLF